MTCSKVFAEKCSLKKKEEEPIVTTVGEKCMFDLYNELDDEEDDLQKIVEQTYKIFFMLLQKKKNLIG